MSISTKYNVYNNETYAYLKNVPSQLQPILQAVQAIPINLFYKYKSWIMSNKLLLSKVPIKFTCICCGKEQLYNLDSFIHRNFDDKNTPLICRFCLQSMTRGNHPLELAQYINRKQAIPYNLFLKYKDTVRTHNINLPIEITCNKCGAHTTIEWRSLIKRKTHCEEQICRKCMYSFYSKDKLQGYYYGIYFESGYELSFIHCCIKNNIMIKRSDLKIPYRYKGKTLYYYPDFIINDDVVVEVKGFHHNTATLKTTAARDFCAKNNLLYVFIDYDILKQLNNFIHLSNAGSSFVKFDQEQLQFSNVPHSYMNIPKVTSDKPFIGYVYIITDLVNNKKYIDYYLSTIYDANFIFNTKYKFINKDNKNNFNISIVYYAPSFYKLLITYTKYLYKYIYTDKTLTDIQQEYLSELQWKDIKYVSKIDYDDHSWNAIPLDIQQSIIKKFYEVPYDFTQVIIYDSQHNIIDTLLYNEAIKKYNLDTCIIQKALRQHAMVKNVYIQYKYSECEQLRTYILNNRYKNAKQKVQ